MKAKSPRTFLLIWTALVIIFLAGLVVAFILSQQITTTAKLDASVTARYVTTNTAFAELYQTQTANDITPTVLPYTADMSPTALPLPSFTPTIPPYTADMSPTSPLSPQQLTQWSATLTARVLITPTVTSTPVTAVSYPSCAFMWARQDLPIVTEIVQTALKDAGIGYVTARAEAYGENCVGQDQSISYFAAMTTDFYLTIPVNTLDDDQYLGEIVRAAYHMLVAIPEKSLPAKLGYLDITFAAAEQSKHFRTMFPSLRPLIEGEANPETLLAAGMD
ncbi:MAG: hypothetical protein R3E39_31360 [Anaerolineae bacterium]